MSEEVKNGDMENQPVKKEKKHRVSGFFKDFKAFISKGNVVDLAVAVVIGAAFGAIVTSLVNDMIMPLISAAFGVHQFDMLSHTFPNGSILAYGKFIQTIVNFLLIAFSIFLVLKIVMNMQKGLSGLTRKQKKEKLAEAAQTPPPPAETEMDVLKDIRELLIKQSEKEDKQ